MLYLEERLFHGLKNGMKKKKDDFDKLFGNWPDVFERNYHANE